MRKLLFILPFAILFLVLHKWQDISTTEATIVHPKTQTSKPDIPHDVKQRYLTHNTRYKFRINKIDAQIPYATNLDIQIPNPHISRVVLAIHSSSYNPDTYLDNTLALLKASPKIKGQILIIAPAFYKHSKTTMEDIVTWKNAPFWGSSRAQYQDKNIQLSAYEILDHILTKVITSNNFPNLKDIVLLGHSAGGQMVNRYAASNTIETRIASLYNVTMKYLVMAPSSYVYFNNKRVMKDSLDKFKIPKEVDIKYNVWGYGLDKLYSYHKRHNITASKIINQYAKRKILYLVGENDDKQDKSLGKSKSAMMQGKNRKERAIIYYNHLQAYFGNSITKLQTLNIITGVGHWGKALMLSKTGREFILLE